MLTINNTFNRFSAINDPNRVVLAQLYYGDQSNFIGVATRSIRLGAVQYLGLVSAFSSPKVSWQWATNNMVVISTPTIELGNFESKMEAYSYVDQFYTNNFLGRKIKIFIGYQGSTSINNFVQIYNGVIEDLEFENGTIRISIKTNDLPTKSIAGRKLDYSSPLVSGMPEDADGLTIPVPFGYQWNSPGVCYKTGSYIFDDRSAWPSGYVQATPMRYARRNAGQVSGMALYFENDNYLVPIANNGFSELDAVTWAYNSTLSGLCAVLVSGTSVSGDLTEATAFIPMRFPYDSTASGINRAGGAVSIGVSGTLADYMDGSDSTKIRLSVVHTSNGRNALRITQGLISPIDYNLRTLYTPAGVYEEHSERPIHIGNRSAISDTYLYGKMTLISSSIGALPSYYRRIKPDISIYDRSLSQLVGRTGVQDYVNMAIGDTFGAWSYCMGENPISGNDVDGFAPVASYLFSGINEPHDAMLSRRESWDKYRVVFEWRFATISSDNQPSAVYDLKELCILHTANIDVPSDYGYCELQGLGINGASMITASGSNYVLRKGPQYIEALIRRLDTTASFDTASWLTTLSECDPYRDWSGFVITEETKFDEWLREYLKGETYTIYKDEIGNYRSLCFKENYDSSDVNAIIKYEDCIKLSMSLSPLDSVCHKIKNLNIDFSYFNDSCILDMPFYISDAGYDKTFNGLDQDSFEVSLSKKYTSNAGGMVVQRLGIDYRCLKPSTGVDPATDTQGYWQSLATEGVGIPVWQASKAYKPLSSEGLAIARRYLNQFGNRHRVISATSADPSWYAFQLGDVVEFSGVPDKLLGLSIGGFGGSTATTATINGQTVYKYFIITSILKNPSSVDIECVQLHNLTTLDVSNG